MEPCLETPSEGAGGVVRMEACLESPSEGLAEFLRGRATGLAQEVLSSTAAETKRDINRELSHGDFQ